MFQQEVAGFKAGFTAGILRQDASVESRNFSDVLIDIKVEIFLNKVIHIVNTRLQRADMAELADALDLGSSGNTRAGSSPVIRSRFYEKLSDVIG